MTRIFSLNRTCQTKEEEEEKKQNLIGFALYMRTIWCPLVRPQSGIQFSYFFFSWTGPKVFRQSQQTIAGQYSIACYNEGAGQWRGLDDQKK